MTYVYRPIVMPMLDAHRGSRHRVAAVALNPGIERVQITRSPRDGGWQLRRRTADSFVPSAVVVVRETNPLLSVRMIDDAPDATTVQVQDSDGAPVWDFTLGAVGKTHLLAEEGLVILASNNADPNDLDVPRKLRRIVEDIMDRDGGDAAWATLVA